MQREDRPYKILFLCTGNSARSILSEYLMKQIGEGRFASFSAGTVPTGRVNPFALWVLKEIYHLDANDARSKSTDEFAGENLDFVITVCDNAREQCPVWPAQPITAHWGVADPASATGTDEQIFQEFKQAALLLQRRLELFCALPFDRLDRSQIEKLAREMGAKTDFNQDG